MVLMEEDGGLSLIVRIGDTYPNQILDPIVRAYLYRWPGHPLNPGPDYTVRPNLRAPAVPQFQCMSPTPNLSVWPNLT